MWPPSLPVHTCNQEIYILIIYVIAIRNRITDLSKPSKLLFQRLKKPLEIFVKEETLMHINDISSIARLA